MREAGGRTDCPRAAGHSGKCFLDQGLIGDGLVHQGGEIVRRHSGEHAVNGLLQLGVALHHGDADVDLALVNLKVVVGVCEVQNLHVGIGGHGTHSGGHIGADEVHGVGLQGHQHGGGGLRGSLDLGALDLRQAGVIPDGGDLRGAGAAGKVADAGGVGIGAVRLGHTDDGGVVVGAGEIHLLAALGSHGLAGNDGVKGTGLHAGNQRVPVGLNHFQLPAVGLADLLGDHHVVAVGIGAGHVGDGHSAVGVVALAPVVRGVGALHGDGQHAVLHAGGAGGLPAFSGGAGIAGVGSVAGAASAAAGGQGRCHGQSHQQGQQSLHVSSPFSSQKRFRGGHRPPPRLPPAERRKNGPLCQAVHGKYGKKPPAGTIPNSH